MKLKIFMLSSVVLLAGFGMNLSANYSFSRGAGIFESIQNMMTGETTNRGNNYSNNTDGVRGSMYRSMRTDIDDNDYFNMHNGNGHMNYMYEYANDGDSSYDYYGMHDGNGYGMYDDNGYGMHNGNGYGMHDGNGYGMHDGNGYGMMGNGYRN